MSLGKNAIMQFDINYLFFLMDSIMEHLGAHLESAGDLFNTCFIVFSMA